MKRKYSQISNIILLAILIVIVLRENYISKAYNLLLKNNSNQIEYNNNPSYKDQLSIYPYYRKKGAVVMLGNSITYRVNWNELLDRDDIINRGIGNDITKGFLSRLEYVYNVEPTLCFIMGGINDILKNQNLDTIPKNIKTISQRLKNKQIEAYVQSILYVSKTYPEAEEINKKVKYVNESLQVMCDSQDIHFIDLNLALAPNGFLEEQFSIDGLHLKGLGYEQWKKIILPIIESKVH